MNRYNSLAPRIEAIRSAILRGDGDDAIALRLGTTPQAVRVVRKGMAVGMPQANHAAHSSYAARPQVGRNRQAAPACPWLGRFVAIDGANVCGWGCRKGEPRLVQVLAICRWFAECGVRFTCWFDSNFRWCLAKRFSRDAAVLEGALRHEPDVFKQAPAGVDSDGVPRKADPYVIHDAATYSNSLIVSDDLYRKEIEANPDEFAWLRDPARRIVGEIASNGDVLLGDHGQVRIPVENDPQFYIR